MSHFFLVFLLLTLSIFLLVGFVVSKDTWLQTVAEQKRNSIWSISWNVSITDIFRVFCWNSKLTLFKEYLSMADSNGYFVAYHVALEDSLP